MIVASQQRFSGFQVTGMIEWGQKSKPKSNRTSNNIKKSLDQKLTLKKSHAKFPSLKNYQNITQKILKKKKTFAPQIFGFFEYRPPSKKNLLSSYSDQATQKSPEPKISIPPPPKKNPLIIPITWIGTWNPEHPPWELHWCVFSCAAPNFRPILKKHTRFQTWPLGRSYVITGALSANKKNSLNPFGIRIFLFLSYSQLELKQ